MKKIGLLFLIIALLMVPATLFSRGTQESAKDSGKMKIAVVLKTLSSEYWQRVVSGADEAAAHYGVELIKLGPPTEDAIEQQINMVQDALAQNPAALVFSPSQPPTAVNVMDSAKAKGIPVVLVDTPMPDGYANYATFIGTENYAAGKLGAEALIKAVGPGAKAIIIEGAPGNPTTTQRADGAQAAFQAAGITVLARQPGYSDRERAYTVMQNLLQTHGSVNIVFASNDEMALGALRALQQAGVKAAVMGTDGNKEALESILADGLFASVAQKPEAMGYLGVEIAITLANGGTVEKRIDSGVDVIVKETAQAALDNLK
ncbi:sugar ABC transporter substrate-binding protein [Parasphaerochaeta coccoides]|uniref:Periplasmic binding protein/LacI transcriptional regulator n=1 Tax=Parasphaerochaeta coccoides (strain ATCC BAA-1237 / DSM 17374 / SPN1) TaxID=760011 RepID=F4GJ25_PARC1|nr:sugar ABC transporter substrate-binding protein [Parasphaerochaeta coccoides]AEC01320.1 periplasmic binding protein/LacI transcriptional regulator [Parasphaerochaeta coccoides DSM 17374]